MLRRVISARPLSAPSSGAAVLSFCASSPASLRWSSSSSASALPSASADPQSLRPITALYGRRIYKLEALVGLKSRTLYDVAATDGGAGTGDVSSSSAASLPSGDEVGVQTDGSGAAKKAERRRHVNKYMNPQLAAQREGELRALREGKKSEGGGGVNGRPVFTVKPVLRYPMLNHPSSRIGGGVVPPAISEGSHNNTTPSPHGTSVIGGIGSRDLSLRKQQYLNVKAPEMVIMEVTELGVEDADATASMGGASTSSGGVSASPFIKATHHVAVFSDGTVVGFGLNDEGLRRIRSEILDPHSEAKDVMLTADKEVIRLAARTNLCVFPAMDGEEAEMMTTTARGGAVTSSPTTATTATQPSATNNSSSAVKFPSARKRIQNIFPTSAADIDRLASNNAVTDISLRYRFTTVDDLLRSGLSSVSSSSAVSAQSSPQQSNSNCFSSIVAIASVAAGVASLPTSAATAASPHHYDYSSVGSAAATAPPTTSYIDEQTLEAVVLSENTALAVLPFAFCFFELIQLRALNALVFPILEKVSAWQLHVAERGTLPMDLKEARVLKARLMRISSRHAKMTTRRHRLLWEEHHTEARQVFVAAAEHFELSSRNEGFKRRADGVQSSLAYLCDQAHQQKDVLLEWVIIALISVEVYLAIKAHAHDYDDDGEGAIALDDARHPMNHNGGMATHITP